MCTINSLVKRYPLFSFYSSLRTVLIAIIILINQGSSGARDVNNNTMMINVMAPADITINIKRNTGCDTLINLPAATFTGQCAGPLSFTTYSVYNSLNTSGGQFYFTSGVFKVFYTVSDDCGMTGIDSMLVHVYDASLPNVVCNPKQTMNLPSNGFIDAPAWIFDAGSSDSCGHVYFKVKRMFPPSGYTCENPGNPSNAFDDQIRFCCEDLDSGSIMVILRVYDLNPGLGPVSDQLLKARSVDCMIEAIVLDKIAPDIDCPKNLTVSCGADLDSILSVSQLHLVNDNCPGIDVEINDVRNLDACGSGNVERIFIATDNHGQVSSCSQVITVLKVNTFNGLDTNQLKWPGHKVVFACRIDPDTINAGIPFISEDECANVLVSKRDERYNFDRGGVCSKILRYWEVIDWCRYNPNLSNPKTALNGFYSYLQEIKIMDTLAPVLSGLRDTVIGLQTASCQPGMVTLPPILANDCGSINNITIRYQIDYFNDGQLDFNGSRSNASGLYPIGTHRLIFYANDSCHNTGTLSLLLHIIDSKPPNANAIFGLASSLVQMQAGPMVSISATLFNSKSTDNCTNENDLRFSFSPDINDTIRTFNCDSIGLRRIQLYVWDLAGNSSVVSTFITITDVNSLCPSGIPGTSISGVIQTTTSESIKDVEVSALYDNVEIKTFSDPNGNFAFPVIPRDKDLRLILKNNKQFPDGISTADIIKIQRHILGLDPLKSPIELFAADVDLNKSITTRDIIWLRRLILGQITEIPNQDSYLFLNKNFQFVQTANPFDELDSAKVFKFNSNNNLSDINILAIKLGDVNQSFKANGIQIKLNKTLKLFYRLNENFIEIFSTENKIVDGFQLDLISKDLCLNSWSNIQSDLDGWSDSNYQIKENKIRISYSDLGSVILKESQPIFRIPVSIVDPGCIPLILLNTEFQNEFYENGSIFSVSLSADIAQVKNTEIKIFPNPFGKELGIFLNAAKEESFQLNLYSLDNKKMYSQQLDVNKGINSFYIKNEILPGKGIYILHLKNNNNSEVFKIINE